MSDKFLFVGSSEEYEEVMFQIEEILESRRLTNVEILGILEIIKENYK
jgi:hypothetical protein